MGNNKIHVDCLTSLRGLAALVVVLAHTTGYYQRPDWLDLLIHYTPIKLLLDSGVAVNLFFVLSGFVLSVNYVGKKNNNNPQNINIYCLYRVIRICFPYWAILLLSYLAHNYLFSPIPTNPSSNAYILWESTSNFKQFILDAALVKANHPFYFVPQAWTLAVELKISLLMPLFIYFANRSRVELCIFTLALLTIFKLPHYVFNFCFGVIIAYHYKFLATSLPKIPAGSKIFLLILSSYICSIPAILKLNYHEYIYLGVLTHAIGTSILLLAAISFKNFLEHRYLIYLGKISYSLYLTHMLVILLVTPRFIYMLNQYHIDGISAKISAIVLTVVVSLICAHYTYRIIEAPVITLGKSIITLYQSIINSGRLKFRRLFMEN